jgi:PleD family two-component response regulator
VVSSFDPESLLPSVTISIGVAAGSLSSLDMLVLEADRALYRAKDEGRNRVALARPEDRPGRQRAAA